MSGFFSSASPNLRICPFCYSQFIGVGRISPDSEQWAVHCSNCYANGPSSKEFDQAVALWNAWAEHKEYPVATAQHLQ